MEPFILILALLYFLPTVVAMSRRIKTPQGPILLNLLLGWTILGWIGALIWAACAPAKTKPLADGAQAAGNAMYRFGRALGTVREKL
jgi:hypothetical protein